MAGGRLSRGQVGGGTARRRWPWLVGLGLVAAVGLGAMGLSAVVLGGRGEVERRLGRWAERHDLRVDVGNVSASLTGALRVIGLEIAGGPGGGVAARFEAVDVQLDLMDVWRGSPRPRDVGVHGGTIAIRIDDAALAAWRKSGDDGGEPAKSDKSARLPDHVGFDGLTLRLAVTARGLALPALELTDAAGSVERAEGGQWRLTARGRLTLEGRPRVAELTLTTGATPSVTLAFDGPVEVAAHYDGRPVALRASTFHRDARGVTRLEGVEATLGDLTVACGVLEASDAGGLVPDASEVRRVRCDGAAVSAGTVQGEAKQVVVEGEAPVAGVPEPRRIEVEGLSLQAASGRLSARASGVRLELGSGAVGHALAGRWKDALVAVDLRGPALRIEVPGSAGLGALSELDVVAAANPGEPGGADEPPGAMEGEDAPPPEDAPAAPPKTPGKDARKAKQAAAREAEFVLDRLGPEPLRLPRGAALVELLRGVRLTLERGRVEVDTPERAAALRIDDLSLDVSAGDDGGLQAHVAAALKRSEGRSGSFDLYARVDRDGSVQSANGSVAGADIAHVLSSSSDYVTVAPEAWVQVDFTYGFEAAPTATHSLRGEAKFEDFGFQAWRISHAPISGLEGRGALHGLVAAVAAPP
jgi:hypothetical protein